MPRADIVRPADMGHPCDRKRCEEGMSLLEVLIASALILVIAVGLLPLLARSMINNAKGWRATESTAHSRSSLEEFLEKDLLHADLEVAGTETTQISHLTTGSDTVGDTNEGWWPDGVDISAKGRVEWTRTTTTRQYNVNDLATPIAGASSSPYVHLKESHVVLETTSTDAPLTEGRKLEIRVLKAF